MVTTETITRLLSQSLGCAFTTLIESHEIRDRAGREVIDCTYQGSGAVHRSVLKIYHPGFDDDSELGMQGVARKNQLAAAELSGFSIYIPDIHGVHLSDDLSCIVMERLDEKAWERNDRSSAAEILAQMHDISFDSLSGEFQRLVRDSKPNQDRGKLGVIGRSRYLDHHTPQWRERYPELSGDTDWIAASDEPVSSLVTLVHGDYYSVNLIPTADGMFVIDWDLLALGDPMWDLGLLIGADNDLSQSEIEEVVRAYTRTRPVDETVLNWQQDCWKTLRELIRLMKEHTQ